ncbi:hypothetical protein FACS1894170_03250 [Planctomycetales bacterium]|nr:hypothetical protein FACS1894170_03250 [Planctomycetales bacterium]
MNKTSLNFAAILLVTAVITAGIVLMLQNLPNKPAPKADIQTAAENTVDEPEPADEPLLTFRIKESAEEPPKDDVVAENTVPEDAATEHSNRISPEPTEAPVPELPPVQPTPEVAATPKEPEAASVVPAVPVIADLETTVAKPETPVTAPEPVMKTKPAPEVKALLEPVALYPVYPVYPIYPVQNTRLIPVMPIYFPIITKVHLGRTTLVYNNGVIITVN